MSGARPAPDAGPLSGAKLDALAELCRRFHVRTLDAFGSAVTGRFDPARSDLDFVAEFDSEGERAGLWLGFEQELERLFGRPVDVLSESSLENPFLRRSVAATRRRLFPPAARGYEPPIDPAMSDKQLATYLWDAIEAAKLIEQFMQGRTFQEYLSDPLLRAGVEREFQIIGEALSALRRIDPTLAARIPNLSTIVAFRNILVHAYFKIRHDRVWQTAERDLPILRPLLERLLGEASGP